MAWSVGQTVQAMGGNFFWGAANARPCAGGIATGVTLVACLFLGGMSGCPAPMNTVDGSRPVSRLRKVSGRV